ncbi:MAG: 6-carboxytetrahydropterin synthase [Planctomycetota bacterium]
MPQNTYRLEVEHVFSAAHALSIAGAREPLHGHDWRVTATIAGDTLDDDGLLADFHSVHGFLAEICEPFNNNTLNDVAPFDETNPSAENVAEYIAAELAGQLEEIAEHCRVAAVRVTEAPGCAASYFPPTG